MYNQFTNKIILKRFFVQSIYKQGYIIKWVCWLFLQARLLLSEYGLYNHFTSKIIVKWVGFVQSVYKQDYCVNINFSYYLFLEGLTVFKDIFNKKTHIFTFFLTFGIWTKSFQIFTKFVKQSVCVKFVWCLCVCIYFLFRWLYIESMGSATALQFSVKSGVSGNMFYNHLR